MPIRKDKTSGVWRIDIRTPSGERIRRSIKTTERKSAQEYHDKLKVELWRQDRLGERRERLFDEAAVPFLNLKKGQNDYEAKVRHIAYWRTIFGGQPLSSLTTEAITSNLPTHFSRHGSRVKRLVSASTKNRYLATIRSMLNLAHRMEWIDRTPSLSNYREPAIRVRFLTKEQACRFLDAIEQKWMRDIAQFALATGMRSNEIMTLQWDNVDLSRAIAWVDAGNAKSRTSRQVPLNVEALAVLRSRPRERLVFTRTRGKQLTQIDNRMINNAFAAVDARGFRFHDLRHTWASWHVQAGTPLFALKELGGWKTLEMVKKYAHLAPEHLAQYANAVTFWSHSPEPDKKKGLTLIA